MIMMHFSSTSSNTLKVSLNGASNSPAKDQVSPVGNGKTDIETGRDVF